MKIIKEQIRPLALALLLMGGLGVSSCSTGTSDGDASVEKGGPKDINSTKHNENANNQGQPRTDTSTMENMEEPYEKASEMDDKDGDGQVDQAGTTGH